MATGGYRKKCYCTKLYSIIGRRIRKYELYDVIRVLFSRRASKERRYDKLTLHSNLNHNFTDWLTIGSHIQMAYSEKDGNNDVMTGLFQRGWPTMPVYNEDGSYYVSSLDPIHSSYIEGNFNPIADINGTTATNSSFLCIG